MARKKIEDFIKENAALQSRVYTLEAEDKRIRTELTAILRYENVYVAPSLRSDPMTWLQIAFHIGELRADANYALVVEQVKNLTSENEELRKPKPSV